MTMGQGQISTYTAGELPSVGEIKANALIQGDCLEVMPYLADGSFHAIIVDLPYG